MIENKFLKILFYPIAFLYGIIISIRHKFYDFHIIKSYEFADHIINVGNLSVGGVGKTPMVEYLTEFFLKNNYNVIVISRGYRRKLGGLTVVLPESSWEIAGDEPAQIKQKFPEAHVIVNSNRIEAIKYAKKHFFEKEKRNIIILDDAFQYRKITGTFNILLIDINKMIDEDYYIPVGTLRDNPSQKKKANIIVFTKCQKELSSIEKRTYINRLQLRTYQRPYFSKIIYKDLLPAFSNTYVLKLKNITSDYHILLVTAIAKPQYLISFLQNYTNNIIHIKYADHYEFTENDFIEINNRFNKIKTPKRFILTTEKDYVRMKDSQGVELIKNYPVYYLPIKNDFLTNEEKEMFNKQILAYVNKNFAIS